MAAATASPIAPQAIVPIDECNGVRLERLLAPPIWANAPFRKDAERVRAVDVETGAVYYESLSRPTVVVGLPQAQMMGDREIFGWQVPDTLPRRDKAIAAQNPLGLAVATNRIEMVRGTEGAVIAEFYARGQRYYVSQSSLNALNQTWGPSRPFGELLHALLEKNADLKNIHNAPPAPGTFRVWQLAATPLLMGSHLPSHVVLLEQSTFDQGANRFIRRPHAATISVAQAREWLNQGETVMILDAETKVPIVQVKSPQFYLREYVHNDDPVLSRLFNETAGKIERGVVFNTIPEFANIIAARDMDARAKAAVILQQIVHPERRDELRSVIADPDKEREVFAAFLLGLALNAGPATRETFFSYFDPAKRPLLERVASRTATAKFEDERLQKRAAALASNINTRLDASDPQNAARFLWSAAAKEFENSVLRFYPALIAL